VLSQLEGVQVRRHAVLPDKDQLVLGAIERPHAAVVLVPDAQVLEFQARLPSGGQHLAHVPPVHEHEQHGAVPAVGRHGLGRLGQEAGELSLRHLAGGHHELRMLNGAEPADMTTHPDIVGRVGYNNGGPLGAEQGFVNRRIPSVPAGDPMIARLP
jgi:hypothetical protein